MDWTRTLLAVIDFRSFSSLWYWIVLAVMWSSASHYVLGVPFDMIARARRYGGQATADLEEATRINVRRLLHIAIVSGPWLAGVAAFLVTGLLVLAVWYGVEFAQALLLLLGPMMVVGGLALAAARRIHEGQPEGEALIRSLLRHRFWTQVVGMVSIFATAMFGMYHNLAVLRGVG